MALLALLGLFRCPKIGKKAPTTKPPKNKHTFYGKGTIFPPKNAHSAAAPVAKRYAGREIGRMFASVSRCTVFRKSLEIHLGFGTVEEDIRGIRLAGPLAHEAGHQNFFPLHELPELLVGQFLLNDLAPDPEITFRFLRTESASAVHAYRRATFRALQVHFAHAAFLHFKFRVSRGRASPKNFRIIKRIQNLP